MSTRAVYLVSLISLCLYLAALMLPAFHFDGGRAPLDGWAVLRFGWLGLIVADPRWLANIAYAIVVTSSCLGRDRRIVASIGIALVAGSILLPITYYPTEAESVLVDRLGLGACLWFASLLTSFAVPFARKRDVMPPSS